MGKVKRRVSRKKTKTAAKKVGQVPGAVIYVGDKEYLDTKMEVFDYSPQECKIFETNLVAEAHQFHGNNHVTWINVNGLSHTKEILDLGKQFELHPLIMEDIVNTEQRPKLDEYEQYLYVVIKMLYFNKDQEFTVEHISLVLGDDYVITFQETDEDTFGVIRDRLNNELSRLRNSGADYLAFSLLDSIVDNYFTVIERLEGRLETLEDELFNETNADGISHDIQELKHDILKIRRNVIPAREVIGRITKSETKLIAEKTHDYYRDLYDHILHINENIEVYREMTWSLMDMYMTTISNKMNSIMKVLTIIATIFIPLTFIAGIYGMNFEYMPELQYRYGYFVLIAVMVIVFIGLLFYFRRKKWL